MTPLQTTPSGGIPLPIALRCRPALDDLAALLDPQPIAAGVVIRDQRGRVLLLKRGDGEANYAGHWGLPGGGIDDGETPEQAARRECQEETGHELTGDLEQISEVVTGTGRGTFVTFGAQADEPFAPKFADGEHTDFMWADPEQPPAPLHPAVAELMKGLEPATDKLGAADAAMQLPLALDRDSVRTKIGGTSGDLWRLQVKDANISKACVSPYLGREIPNSAALGLEPDKIYHLLRHPDEIKKALPTANGLPILRKHIPVSADDHKPYDVVGATGNSATFEHPYLRNGLSIWARDAIDGIDSGDRKELSCGYGYRAEMTPGAFDGIRYDGVMRDMTFNHVTLVEDGRAGPDVVVGDTNEEIMAAKETARQLAALSTRQVSIGALAAYLAPRLAMDARPNLPKVLSAAFAGVPVGPGYKTAKPDIAKRIRDAKPKLAADTSLDDVEKVLDLLDKHEVDGTEGTDESVSEAQHNAMAAAAAGASELDIPKKVGQEFTKADAKARDDASVPTEDFIAALKAKGATEEEIAAIWALAQTTAPGAVDADLDEKQRKEEKEAMQNAEKDKDKKAMDAAITSAVTTAVTNERKQAQGVRQAEAEVRPWVGDLPPTIAFDSAEQVRRHALKILGVPGHDTMHADALGAVLAVQPKPGAARPTTAPALIAQDEATTSSFAKNFPGSERIRAA